MIHTYLKPGFAVWAFLVVISQGLAAITASGMPTMAQAHLAQVPAKVRWEVLMVRKDKYRTRDEAFRVMAAMGKEIFLEGAPFAAVARRSSQGYKAGGGGLQDWTTQSEVACRICNETTD